MCYIYKSKYSDERVGRIYISNNLGYCEEDKCHKGLTKNHEGEYIMTIENENNKNYAYKIDKEDALKEILKYNKQELLKTFKFKDLVDVFAENIDK